MQTIKRGLVPPAAALFVIQPLCFFPWSDKRNSNSQKKNIMKQQRPWALFLYWARSCVQLKFYFLWSTHAITASTQQLYLSFSPPKPLYQSPVKSFSNDDVTGCATPYIMFPTFINMPKPFLIF